ncbi:OLC1v1013032C1 [Oldenlandia corymbosa var. corymbosa]|uniref:OLC1v1013032C1 n=1 Tax=Oldenlandia corymbosa var. corymbosa TaxID=529605 RepID=A0AAV1DXA2_OLDCO|nr:OLC1v1013032C1 [Oldenlandia corymbosa var. corymbosa]
MRETLARLYNVTTQLCSRIQDLELEVRNGRAQGNEGNENRNRADRVVNRNDPYELAFHGGSPSEGNELVLHSSFGMPSLLCRPIKEERMDLDYLCDRELVQKSYDQGNENVINFGVQTKVDEDLMEISAEEYQESLTLQQDVTQENENSHSGEWRPGVFFSSSYCCSCFISTVDGDHLANTNEEGQVAANNGEDEQVEDVNANGGSKDAALKNNPYIRDPLSNIVGPMTRARRKRMNESLNSLIVTTWAKEEIKLEDYKPKTINLLQVTPNGHGPFGEKNFGPQSTRGPPATFPHVANTNGDHLANTNGEGHVAANNGEDEQVEVVNANGGSKDAALKNNPFIRDPLSNIVGPMTRARRKSMNESLNSLIVTTWAKEEIKLEDYNPKTINLLQVTPNGHGPFGEKNFGPQSSKGPPTTSPHVGRIAP